jgi:hypothetical protein
VAGFVLIHPASIQKTRDRSARIHSEAGRYLRAEKARSIMERPTPQTMDAIFQIVE